MLRRIVKKLPDGWSASRFKRVQSPSGEGSSVKIFKSNEDGRRHVQLISLPPITKNVHVACVGVCGWVHDIGPIVKRKAVVASVKFFDLEKPWAPAKEKKHVRRSKRRTATGRVKAKSAIAKHSSSEDIKTRDSVKTKAKGARKDQKAARKSGRNQKASSVKSSKKVEVKK